MNIDQLKKQAKNFRKAFPALVAAHGGQLTLAQAQRAIAQINGYQSWERMSRACASSATPNCIHLGDVLRDGLYLAVDAEPSELPTRFSPRTGEPTRYELAHEARFWARSQHEDLRVIEMDESIDRLFMEAHRREGQVGDRTFVSLGRKVLEGLEPKLRAALDAVPLSINTHQNLVGVLSALGRYEAALEASEPVVETLLGMLPHDRRVQLPYGLLSNRPLYRLMYAHMFVLHELGKHPAADAIAKRAVELNPQDNMGFRFLKTRRSRTLAIAEW